MITPKEALDDDEDRRNNKRMNECHYYFSLVTNIATNHGLERRQDRQFIVIDTQRAFIKK